jgi:hypothetical protein
VSHDDDDGLVELERRLDAAFAATRPGRAFEDELWARLQARRPWWRRLGAGLGSRGAAPWATAGALATLLVAGALVLTLGHGGGGGGSASRSAGLAAPLGTQAATAGESGSASAPARGAAPAPAASPALAFGRLPAPSGAGVAPAGAFVRGANPPGEPPVLPVYVYKPGSGPADGTIVDPGAIPPGLTSAPYPTRPAADAVAGSTANAGQGSVALTQARLVYVAVVADGQGYLEPAYLYTGQTAAGDQARLLVPALAAVALR